MMILPINRRADRQHERQHAATPPGTRQARRGMPPVVWVARRCESSRRAATAFNGPFSDGADVESAGSVQSLN